MKTEYRYTHPVQKVTVYAISIQYKPENKQACDCSTDDAQITFIASDTYMHVYTARWCRRCEWQLAVFMLIDHKLVKHIKTIQDLQKAQLSPSDRAMRLVSSNLANCHTTVQKLLIQQVLTKLMVWSWRFSRRKCVMNNVHSTMTRPSRLPLSQVS